MNIYARFEDIDIYNIVRNDRKSTIMSSVLGHTCPYYPAACTLEIALGVFHINHVQFQSGWVSPCHHLCAVANPSAIIGFETVKPSGAFYPALARDALSKEEGF